MQQRLPEPAPDTDVPDADRWKALAVCLIAGFMTLLDVSIVNVAIPSIRTGLHASSSDLQWITAGYALAFGLVLVSAGRVGDARSRRLVFASGLVVFTVASGLAGAATGPLWLIIARIVQGFGAGVVSPQVAGFIQTLFRGQERARAFGLFGATVGLSTAVGPLIGGALVVAAGPKDGWRWVFYVNLPIGAVALALVRRYLPAPDIGARDRQPRQRLDPVGIALLAVGVCLVLWPLVEGPEDSLAGRAWWLEALAAAVLAAFIGWERRLGRRGGQPVIDLELFRLRSYAFGTTIAATYFAAFTGIFLVLTLYLQAGLKYDALLAGVSSTPFALGSAAAAAVGGRIVLRFGRSLIVVGLLLVSLGVVAVALIVGQVHHDVGLVIAPALLVAGVGSGLVIAPNQTLTLSEVPHRGGGSGAGVVQTAQRVGSAVGIAVLTAVFFSRVAGVLGGSSSAGAAGGSPGGHASPHVVDVFADALRTSLFVTLVFMALALAVGLLDVGWPGRGRREPADVEGT